MKKNLQPGLVKNQANTQTQTDFSDLFLLDKLKEKDRQIQKLIQELIFYKNQQKNYSTKIPTTSMSNLQQIPECSPSEKSLRPFSSHRTVKRVPFIADYPFSKLENYPKAPSPPQISEYSGLAPRSNSRISRRKAKNTRLNESTASIVRIYSASQNRLRSTKRLNRDSSLISDLVYNENQSPMNWEHLMNEFRSDSALVKHMLEVRPNQKESIGTEPRPKQITNILTRKSVKSLYRETRPSSCKTRATRPNTAKVERIDWSLSVLDQGTAANKDLEIPENEYFGYKDVEDMVVFKNLEISERVLEKAEKTWTKLQSELMLIKLSGPPPEVTEKNIDLVLENCLSLYKVRALVSKILGLIHQREDLMLAAISADGVRAESDFKELEKIGQEIVQTIAFLKLSKFPVKEFVYLGENYEKKILKDNESFRLLYPGIKNTEIFEDFNC